MNKNTMFSLLLLLLLIFTSNASAENATLTLRLVHPDHDTISFLPPSEVKINKKQYEYFKKDNDNYWISRKIELDLTDMKEAKLEVLTPPTKKEVEALSKQYPNTLMSLEPSYSVTIILNKKGQKKLSDITENNIMKRLAIIFKGKLLIAPIIREKITSGSVVVSGINNYDDAVRLRDMINTKK